MEYPTCRPHEKENDMAKTVIYTGSTGPRDIVCGGIRFTANKPVVVEDDALAGAILAKPGFKEQAEKKAKDLPHVPVAKDIAPQQKG
jgi:hypothetical protein